MKDLGMNEVLSVEAGTTVTVQQYAYEVRYEWSDYSTIEFYTSATLSDEYRSLIGLVDIEFYVPGKYNRKVVQILSLKKVRADKIEQFNAVLAELDETIAKLSSLTYTPSEVPENDGFEAN